MKGVFGAILVLYIFAIVTVVFGYFHIQNEVTGWLNRAQVAADAEQIHTDLVKVKEAMERRNMTKGYAAWLWKTPDNNMEEIYKAVSSLVDRTEGIIGMDKTTTTYQVALDDIRGTVRELELHAWGYAWRHGGYSVLVVWLSIGWVALIITGFFAFEPYY